MRIRKIKIQDIFPEVEFQVVMVELTKPNLTFLVKCLDFKIHEINRIQNVSSHLKKCHIHTDFGEIQMCLETINNNQQQIQNRINWYNLQVAEELWPATYQQTLIYSSDTLLLCLTFREVTKSVRNVRVDKALIQLPKTFYYMNQNGYDIVSPLDHLVESEITGKYYLDYFHLDKLNRSQRQAAKSFLRDLSQLPENNQYINETVYLLEDQAYQWKIKKEDILKLSELEIMDWFLLSILMNLPYIQTKPLIFSYQDNPNTIKKGSIQQFGAAVYLSDYPDYLLTFRSGKCINQYTSLSQQSLKNNYFQILKTYRVVKRNVLSVIKQPNQVNHNESIIKIDQLVSKIDCVEFFIIYMKYFDLSIESIIFKRQTNQLRLTLSQGKYITIKFNKDYIVKQEEISIIINKSNLINCNIDLQNSRVSDKLLILLSNIQSASNIRKLNLSGCKQLTEFGLNTLFQSSNTRNMVDLNLSGTAVTEQTIQLIKSNLMYLNKLTINNCQLISQQLNFKQMPSLERLLAIGTWIDPVFGSRLKVLKLSIEFPIQHLKTLSRMPLQQLKLKLVQNRKQQIVNFMNNLYSSSSYYTKQFIQGTPHKTLKSLDLSQSTVKYKLIKTLFTIKSLNQMSLSKCSNLGDEFDQVNKEIQTISLQQIGLSPRNIKTLINKCIFIRNLNVRGTLSKKQTVDLVEIFNKNINQMFINQSQYSDSLMKYVNKGGAISINKLSIRVFNITSKTQKMIKELSTNLSKLINIECQDQEEIINKIYSLIGRKQNEKSHLRLNYEQIGVIEKKIQKRKRKSDCLELGSCNNTTIFVHKIIQNSRSKNLMRINLRNNRYLSSPIIDFITVFARSQVQSLDIRNCLFKFEDVQDRIMGWENLQEINNGEFEINFNKKNFAEKAQKYLKFLMKIHNIKKLVVNAIKVTEVPFMFSILHFIINHHKLTLETFQLYIQEYQCRQHRMDMEVKNQIIEFWQALLTTITLKSFTFSFNRQTLNQFSIKSFSGVHFQKIKSLNYLNLHKLRLNVPEQPQFYPKIQGLKQLSLNLSQQSYVTDSYLNELVKSIQYIQILDLNISKTSLNSIQKFSSSLKSLKKLQDIQLNFQYCSIKTSHCVNILPSLKQAKQIRKIVMNVSFTLQGSDNLASELISYSDMLNQPLMEIIALRVTKHQQSLQPELQSRYITLLV